MPVPPTAKRNGWYSQLLSNIPVAVLRTTVEGRVIYCNQATLDIFGFDSRELFFQRPVTELYQNVKDRGLFIQSLASKGVIKDLVLGMKKANGTPIWCSVCASTKVDEDGTVEYIDAVLRDITTELGPNYSPFQTQEFEDPTSFVLLIDSKGGIRSITHERASLYGYPIEEYFGKQLSAYLTTKSRKLFPQFLSQAVQRGKVKSIFTILSKSRQEYHLELYAMSNPGDDLIEVIARDITDIVNFQKAQMEQQKFQGVLEMAGGVSHRLNQPLTIINNMASEVLYSLEKNSEEQKRMSELYEHLAVLNDIVKKIGNIRKYASMSYVKGIKIVDIDRSSN
ncbi:MAG: PAS domain-containing protein [Desulfovibrionales bacterium]